MNGGILYALMYLRAIDLCVPGSAFAIFLGFQTRSPFSTLPDSHRSNSRMWKGSEVRETVILQVAACGRGNFPHFPRLSRANLRANVSRASRSRVFVFARRRRRPTVS
eukprot:6185457-Pleurochrysis_carterae.AAC.1